MDVRHDECIGQEDHSGNLLRRLPVGVRVSRANSFPLFLRRHFPTTIPLPPDCVPSITVSSPTRFSTVPPVRASRCPIQRPSSTLASTMANRFGSQPSVRGCIRQSSIGRDPTWQLAVTIPTFGTAMMKSHILHSASVSTASCSNSRQRIAPTSSWPILKNPMPADITMAHKPSRHESPWSVSTRCWAVCGHASARRGSKTASILSLSPTMA